MWVNNHDCYVYMREIDPKIVIIRKTLPYTLATQCDKIKIRLDYISFVNKVFVKSVTRCGGIKTLIHNFMNRNMEI